jgi:hypothetical protein
MKKIILTVLSIVCFISIGLSSSAFASKQNISTTKQLEVKSNDHSGNETLAVPGLVKGAVKGGKKAVDAGKHAWKNIPAGDKHMVSEAAQNAITMGGVEKDAKKTSDDYEYIFDK